MVQQLWAEPAEASLNRLVHGKHARKRVLQLTFWLSAEFKAEWQRLWTRPSMFEYSKCS